MATGRTVTDKIADTLRVYEALRGELTTENMRTVMQNMTGAQMEAAGAAGDVQAYAALVQAALNLSKLVGANDRAAMLAAAMVTQSGIARPVIETEE